MELCICNYEENVLEFVFQKPNLGIFLRRYQNKKFVLHKLCLEKFCNVTEKKTFCNNSPATFLKKGKILPITKHLSLCNSLYNSSGLETGLPHCTHDFLEGLLHLPTNDFLKENVKSALLSS